MDIQKTLLADCSTWECTSNKPSFWLDGHEPWSDLVRQSVETIVPYLSLCGKSSTFCQSSRPNLPLKTHCPLLQMFQAVQFPVRLVRIAVQRLETCEDQLLQKLQWVDFVSLLSAQMSINLSGLVAVSCFCWQKVSHPMTCHLWIDIEVVRYDIPWHESTVTLYVAQFVEPTSQSCSRSPSLQDRRMDTWGSSSSIRTASHHHFTPLPLFHQFHPTGHGIIKPPWKCPWCEEWCCRHPDLMPNAHIQVEP